MTAAGGGWVWLVIALPLAGFLANGWLTFFRPQARGVVSALGVGVLAAAFIMALSVVITTAGASAPVIHRYWSWMPAGPLQIDFALQVDPLSSVMLLVVTGIGTLIH